MRLVSGLHAPGIPALLADRDFLRPDVGLPIRMYHPPDQHGQSQKQPQERMQPPSDQNPIDRAVAAFRCLNGADLHADIRTAALAAY